MDATTVLVNFAYVVLVSATFTRTLLWLRVMLIAGAAMLFTYSVLIESWSVAGWNVVIGTLHTIQLVRILRARRAVDLSPADEAFRQQHFSSIDRFDFFTLWSLGEEVHYEDVRLTSADEEHTVVALILDGVVEIRRRGDVRARLGPGALVGEMSFVSGSSASADSIAVGPVRMRVWEQQRLNALDQLSPVAARAFREFLQKDLAAKVV